VRADGAIEAYFELGHFASRQEANDALEQLKSQFPTPPMWGFVQEVLWKTIYVDGEPRVVWLAKLWAVGTCP
jgi:hypothetical protein